MPQHYHHGLVVVSLLVAILASYTALTLALRIHHSSGFAGRAWLVGGGFAMGIGIWAMHFVGMLALHLPVPLGYDLGTNILSMVVAIAVSTFALHIASRRRLRSGPLVAAGIAMGVGICAMHYIGMASIRIEPPIRYDAAWVSASFAIAIAASFAALWIAFATRHPDWARYRLLGGVVMGFAIVGMHYAGMVAAEFPAGAATQPGTGELGFIDTRWLAGAVTAISVFILIAALLAALMDAQAAARRQRMQESLRGRDEFLAMLSHELRNPLAAITNAVHLLRAADPASEDWRLAYGVIERQSAHMKRMVDDLLDVARASTGKLVLEPQPMDVDAAVRGALDALAAAGRTAGRRIEYRGASVWVRGDRTRLEQVVTNLVVNAFQHTSPEQRVEVELARQGAHARLRVRDEGVGLAPDTAKRVFELFFQAGQGLDRRKGGLGIGLTLVRRIVEQHGGEVSVESDGMERGCTFTVRLPALSAPA